MDNSQDFYKAHGVMTALGECAGAFAMLPTDIASLCELIQGVLIHRDLARFAYGVTLPEQRRDEAHIRPISAMLKQIHALDPRPLALARTLDGRMACVCRHYAVMLCAILRESGVPARARCGFAAYLNPGKFEDHWVTEYWNKDEARWFLVDAQLDPTQRNLFKPDFDPLNVPRDRFIVAGDAWKMCRDGMDPALFGLTYVKLQGLWFIAGNLIRDFAALNRTELLPWDVWGRMPNNDSDISEDTAKQFDLVAALTLSPDRNLAEIRALYQDSEALRVPSVVFNVLRNAHEPIADVGLEPRVQ
jgi:hypothetical protein